MIETTSILDRLSSLVADSRSLGADAADAVLAESRSLTVTCRLGDQEQVERSEEAEVGLRVFIGQRQAIVSSSDLSTAGFYDLAERAVAMARAVPEDPFTGLADPDQLARDDVDVDASDTYEPDTQALFERARAAEAAARAVTGVTNSEGSDASWSASRTAIVASNGFARLRTRSSHGCAVSVLAGDGTAMERDYDYASAVYASDLPDPTELGQSAGTRAVRRLNPRKAASANVPVVFEPRIARSLLGHLAMAINGGAIARGTSFLKDKMGEAVFPASVTVVDDPHRKRGLRSRPFDGEGVATERRAVIDQGVLTTWLLDLRSARKLGLRTTGNASRGAASPPSPAASNLYLEPGPHTPEDLIRDISSGFYVTELIGFGVNTVTGDYSRGASGFWIENGEITWPVSEVTVAGNLSDMFLNLTASNDLHFRYGTDAPTLRIDAMTVAGV